MKWITTFLLIAMCPLSAAPVPPLSTAQQVREDAEARVAAQEAAAMAAAQQEAQAQAAAAPPPLPVSQPSYFEEMMAFACCTARRG